MEVNKPINRHKALQPLSRQHHVGLLFSWKLRKGFSKGIAPERMMKYANWFYTHEIEPHFSDEEKYLFPILDPSHELIERALKEHRRLKRLFLDREHPEKSLHRLEEELDAHIRFEERILFNEIQNVATPEQLEKIEEIHSDLNKTPDYEDPFWDE